MVYLTLPICCFVCLISVALDFVFGVKMEMGPAKGGSALGGGGLLNRMDGWTDVFKAFCYYYVTCQVRQMLG